MKELYELKEKLCDELKSYGKKDMSTGSLDVVDKLSHTIKNLDKIIDRYEEEGYSNENNSYYNNMNNGMSPRYSGARGRNAKRDSMGRYSSRRGGYSGGGYSYHDDMMDELRAMMEDAPDDKTRHEIKRFIEKMESM